MEPKLEIEYVESDPSKIWVTANNSCFAGAMEVYLNKESLNNLAGELYGFPTSNQSETVLELGIKDSRHSYCNLRFYCIDSAGHTAVIVTLANGIASNVSEDNRCIVTFKLQFEASALDSFRSSLLSALSSGKGKATLKGIKAYTQNI